MISLAMIATPQQAIEMSLQAGATLTKQEQRRAAATRHGATRATFIAAHLLVRVCVAAQTSTAAGTIEVRQHCPNCDSAHGRPEIHPPSGTGIGISHTTDMVAAIAGPGRVGIDVEPINRRPSADLRSAALTTTELTSINDNPNPHLAFLQAWVRKEALIKVGAATLDHLDRVDTTTITAGRWNDWWITDFTTPTHIGAAATSTPGCQIRANHHQPPGTPS